MKKMIIIFSIVFSIFVSIGCFAKEKAVIAVIKTSDVISYKVALKGFKSVLKEKKLAVEFKEYIYKDEDLIRKVNLLKPDLILTLGTSATKTTIENINDMPVVFSMVLDPAGMGLKATNLTGASLDISLKTQFKTLKQVIPGVKKVGIIYNPEENRNTITKAKKIASKMSINLLIYPIQSAKEIPKIEELEIDALLIIPDNVVCQQAIIKHILLSSLKRKIPVMGISPAYVKAGAILALSCDYENIGYQSGKLALRILNGQSPSNIPISIPQKTKLYLNSTVANRLGIKFSKPVIKKADYIFGE